jgi:hypothetical protein
MPRYFFHVINGEEALAYQSLALQTCEYSVARQSAATRWEEQLRCKRLADWAFRPVSFC